MNNAFEGVTFVNATFSAEMTVPEYIAQLFPNFNSTQLSDAAAQYENVSTLPTTNDKAVAIVGECTSVIRVSDFRSLKSH